MNISLMFSPIQHILQMSDTAKAMSFLAIPVGRSMLKHWFPKPAQDWDAERRKQLQDIKNGSWISAGEAKYDFLIELPVPNSIIH